MGNCFPSQPTVDINVLIRRKQEGQRVGKVRIEAEVAMINFKDEVGITNQVLQVTPGSWKLEADSFLKPAEGIQLI